MTEERLRQKRWRKELKRREIHAAMGRGVRPTMDARRIQSERAKGREQVQYVPPRPVVVDEAAQVTKVQEGLFKRWTKKIFTGSVGRIG